MTHMVLNNNAALIDAELVKIFNSFEQCIEMRAEYMQVSLQAPGSNPMDSDAWGFAS